MGYRSSIISFLICISLLILGCSGNATDPVTTSNNPDMDIPVAQENSNDNHALLGSWDAQFDLNNLTASVNPERELSSHINVTSFLSQPQIHVNSYNSTTHIIDADFTISNKYPINGYDVRLIIYTDTIGHKLLNADDWTSLYDIAGGLPINPFKAFAKTQPNRLFAGMSEYTENLQIYLPGGNNQIKLAIDASYPSNCEEPYSISDVIIGTLYNFTGASTDMDATIRDWQNNANSVSLYCPQITGTTLVAFSKVSPEQWHLNLVNNTGAAVRNYTGYIMAMSSNSGSLALYDEVTIPVTHGVAIEPPANLELVVNRDSVKPIILAERPFTLSWDPVIGAQEYAIYYDTDPSSQYYYWEFVGTVDGGTTVYDVPANNFPPNRWVIGNTYTVRARTIAGNASTESENSEFAFVSVSCFESIPNRTIFTNLEWQTEFWNVAVQRYPYALTAETTFWPYAIAANSASLPNSVSMLPLTFGGPWTSGTGEITDDFPGQLISLTLETPVIAGAVSRRIDFVATCSSSWYCDDEGGVVIGVADSPNPPSDGWNGMDFRWANAEGAAKGHQPYNYTNSSTTAPFPFNMTDYNPPQLNCWRWASG